MYVYLTFFFPDINESRDGGRYHAGWPRRRTLTKMGFVAGSGQSGAFSGFRGVGILQGIQGGTQGITRGRRHRFDRSFNLRWLGNQRGSRRFGDQIGHIEPEGSGGIEHLGRHEPQFGSPYRGIDNKNEFAASIDIGQPRMRGQLRGQTGA